MVIYNVTVKLELSIADAWLDWLKEDHIPEMKSTGCFFDVRLYHLLEVDELDGITYAIQYHANTIDEYKTYLQDFSESLRKKAIERWGNKFMSFRSLLELVH